MKPEDYFGWSKVWGTDLWVLVLVLVPLAVLFSFGAEMHPDKS